MNYFDLIKPTFIENWPAQLCNLSIAQVDIPLSLRDTNRLQGEIEHVWHALENKLYYTPDVFASSLIKQLDYAINKFPNGAFIRLGSRSPKDSILFCETQGLVKNGVDAISLLTHFSERVWEDLYIAIKNNYAAHIFVREWQEIKPWSEFRCFMKNRRLVGISQYDYHQGYMPEIDKYKNSIRFAIDHFFKQFKKVCHLDDVVFDVYIKQHPCPQNELSWEVRLLELNPLMETTDPCQFDWRNGGDFDGSFRYIKIS